MKVDNDKSREQLQEELANLKEKMNELNNELETQKNVSNEMLVQTKEEIMLSKQSNNIILSNMSHDIRVPMNGIMGMIEVLQQTELNDEQHEYLEIVSNSANNLLNIIDNILDYSKIATGGIRIQKNSFQLNREIDAVYSLQSMRAHGKGLGLGCNISPNLPQNLIGDSTRMKQILNNLISNAIKFTKEGEVLIDVNPVLDDDDGIVIQFTVTDTGIGMSEDQQRLLLNAFEESESLRALNSGVMGIGLSISNSLSKLLGGELRFTSKEGVGSKFWYTARFNKARISFSSLSDNSIISDKKKQSDLLNSSTEKLSILLVEDNVLNQKFATATLRKRGHQVDIAENGKIALQKVFENSYDLVLMDVQMPVMDGVEATIEIRDREEKENLRHMKIIAVTAYALDRDREKCLNAGMDLFLAKPFKPDDLIHMVENLES
jgi:signal transduction histidine kinase/ActR/RegA family two-component response regulator